MKILFVLNSFYASGNGLAASARRTVKALKEAGEEVQVLSRAGKNPEDPQPDYIMPAFDLPGVFGKLVSEEGYAFARGDEEVIRKAVAWADVVHLEEPFSLQSAVCRTAEKMHVPCTCTYHIHPENIFASVGLEHSFLINDATMKIWQEKIFDHCVIMQAPSENAAERLRQYHVKPEIRVISNGILPTPRPAPDPARTTPPYVVVCAGRYSREKNPMLLLKAMRYSRYARRIQLVFAGRGPCEKEMRDAGIQLMEEGVLSYQPCMAFLTYEELQNLSVNADLLVHCADIEVEGMSCMEMIRNGLVPVIARGKYTAASQFARNEKSIFPCGDEKALAQRIDYWLDDDKRRKQEAKKYLADTSRYNIEKSIVQLQNMFHDAARRM